MFLQILGASIVNAQSLDKFVISNGSSLSSSDSISYAITLGEANTPSIYVEEVSLSQGFLSVKNVDDIYVFQTAHSSNSSIALFPNPAREYFSISIGALNSKAIKVVCTDVYGHMVVLEKVGGLTFSTSSFSPGMYLVQVIEEGKLVFQEKLIVYR